jgi:hypothetical protein
VTAMENRPGSFAHLAPAVRRAAGLSHEKRMALLRHDRWIGYPRARQVLDRLDDFLNWPARQRMPNGLIIGPTNNGKSMLIEKFRQSRMRRGAGSGRMNAETLPIVVVQTPSEHSVTRFYAMLLTAAGAPLRPRMRTNELEHLSLRVLRAVGTRILIIDELHNALGAKGDGRREFLNLIRFLGNELKIPIVGVGTREAYLTIRADDQLENRFEPMILSVWEEGDEFLSLLASFAALLPLRQPSEIATPEMARYILTRTGGTIGEISALLTAAAFSAVESGEEALNRRTLLAAAYSGPLERRHAFERALA